MSAYALPGAFPPLDCSFSNSLRSTCAIRDQPPRSRREETVNIAVVEATIDSAMLVQSLVSSSSSKETEAPRPQSQAGNLQQKRRLRRRPGAGVEANATQFTTTPQEESVRIELSITWNGRKYTAVRSLPSFLQLRQELVKECMRGHGEANMSPTLLSTGAHITKDIDCIPEVPRLCEDYCIGDAGFAAGNVYSGVVGRGFGFLQSMLKSAYAPRLEGWLRQVTDMIQPRDSPSLTSFLFEWTQIHRCNSSGSDLMARDGSSSALDSIEETEHDDMDE